MSSRQRYSYGVVMNALYFFFCLTRSFYELMVSNLPSLLDIWAFSPRQNVVKSKCICNWRMCNTQAFLILYSVSKIKMLTIGISETVRDTTSVKRTTSCKISKTSKNVKIPLHFVIVFQSSIWFLIYLSPI